MKNLDDRIKGCIIGGAVGDALGYPVEFIFSHEDIRRTYGEKGIEDYDMEYSWLNDDIKKAQISDDTQMTLYTMEGLLQNEDSAEGIIRNVRDAYLIWMGLQTGEKVGVKDIYKTSKFPELNRRRAPGSTCLEALSSINEGKQVTNDSKGCGGIMRIAPAAVYGAVHGWELVFSAKIAGMIAEITHLHPLSTYSSAACAVLIQLCLWEDEVTEEKFVRMVSKTLDVTRSVYGDTSEMQSFAGYIRNTLGLLGSQDPDWKVIEQKIGEGWVAEESFAIAIYCVARHIDNFQECLMSAVNHGGDSDSTGAIAGNIIGAISGYGSIPEKYKQDLQNLDFMLSLIKEVR